MSVKWKGKPLPSGTRTPGGLFLHDWDVLTPSQRRCTDRLGKEIQLQDEHYMEDHPEVPAMFKMIVASAVKHQKHKPFLADFAFYFSKPYEEIVAKSKDYIQEQKPERKIDKNEILLRQDGLKKELQDIIIEHKEPTGLLIDDEEETPETPSSEFLSLASSETTLPTPEPVPTPEPTFEEYLYMMILRPFEKAVRKKLTHYHRAYDNAYLTLMNLVELAMEITVQPIKEDIQMMITDAYMQFETIIKEQERKAAEKAWENRVSKKIKHSLRLLDNFRGHTNIELKEEIDSHIGPRGPTKQCDCYPKFKYNRYEKDRFGVYAPIWHEDSTSRNVIVTPTISATAEGSPEQAPTSYFYTPYFK